MGGKKKKSTKSRKIFQLIFDELHMHLNAKEFEMHFQHFQAMRFLIYPCQRIYAIHTLIY